MFKEDGLFFHNPNCTKSFNDTNDTEKSDFISDFITNCIERRDKMFNDIILYSYVVQNINTFLIGIGWFSKWHRICHMIYVALKKVFPRRTNDRDG